MIRSSSLFAVWHDSIFIFWIYVLEHKQVLSTIAFIDVWGPANLTLFKMILFLIHYIHLICLIVNIDINPCWGYLWGRLWILWVYLPAFILKWAQLAVFLNELEPLLLVVGVALVWGSSTSQNAHWFAISTIRHVRWVHVHLQIIEYGWFNGNSLWTKYVIAVLGLHHLWIRIGIIFHFHWLLLLRSDVVLSG